MQYHDTRTADEIVFLEENGIPNISSREIEQRRQLHQTLKMYRASLIRILDDDQRRCAAHYVDPWTEEPTGPDVGYMIRTSSHSGRDLRGTFSWPWAGYVEATPESIYGESIKARAKGGLYGLLDGIGDWAAINDHGLAVWQVMAVKRCECKRSLNEWAHRAPRGWVVYSGGAAGAMALIIPKMVSSPRFSEMASGPPTFLMEDYVFGADVRPGEQGAD